MNPDQPFFAVPCNAAKSLVAQGFSPISVFLRDERFFRNFRRLSASR